MRPPPLEIPSGCHIGDQHAVSKGTQQSLIVFHVGRDHCLLAEQQMTQLVCVEEPLVQKYLLTTSIMLLAAGGSYLGAMVMGCLWGQQVHGPRPAHCALLFAWSLGTCTRSTCLVSLTLHLVLSSALSLCPIPAHLPSPLPDCPPPAASQ